MSTDPPDGRGAPRRGRRLALSLLAVPVLLLVAEGGASVLLAWRDAGAAALAEKAHCVYDPLLGWVNEPSVHVEDLYGPGRGLTTNARGFRATEEYDREPPAGRYRIVCLGDSFTLGYGVGDASTYEAHLERLEPRLQVVNMGQGGYGVDQAYLWYLRDGVQLETDLLLLVFIAPNFERMLTDRFQDAYPKPRLVIEDGALVPEREPLPREWDEPRSGGRLGRLGAGLALHELFERLRRRGDAAHPTTPPDQLPYRAEAELLIRHLRDLSAARGQGFALVHLPLLDRRWGNQAAVVAWIDELSSRLAVPLVDLTADFDALPPGELADHYQPDGHLNGAGNALVARSLLRRLGELFPELR